VPIKKCAYCGERMNRVIYGLPTAEDFAVPRPFTEFAGCIIDGLAEDYKCPTCDSKIIKTISPETGACLAELPPKQRQALEIFAKRIQNALVPLGEEEDRVSIQCPHELEDVDSESDWFAGLQFEHNLRGDLLRIKICDCQELTIPLGDGPAILESRGITAYDPWDIRTTYSRTEITDIDVNLSKDHLSELLVWQQPLREVVKATLYARKCDRDYCSGRNDAAEEVIFSEEVDWPTVAYGQSPPAGWLDSRRRELAVEREED
jgi:hypothetical protein